jgi:hypothetical protein
VLDADEPGNWSPPAIMGADQHLTALIAAYNPASGPYVFTAQSDDAPSDGTYLCSETALTITFLTGDTWTLARIE